MIWPRGTHRTKRGKAGRRSGRHAGQFLNREGQIMLRTRRIKAWGMLAAGLVIGLAIGCGLAVGLLIGKSNAPLPDSVMADLKLKAMASHGSDTFAIAT